MNLSVTQYIGSGFFGHIHLGYFQKSDESQKTCTIKSAPSSDETHLLNANFFLRYLHQDAQASSFIESRYSFFGDENGITYLVTEQPEASLLNYVKNSHNGLSLDLTRKIISQVAKALKFLHDSGVLYVNLASENVFLFDRGEQVKLGNFEQATFNKSLTPPSPIASNLCYMSPFRILETHPLSLNDSFWALGILASELFTKTLFIPSSTEELIAFHERLLKFKYPLNWVSSASEEKIELLKRSKLISLIQSETVSETIARIASEKNEEPASLKNFLTFFSKIFFHLDHSKPERFFSNPFLDLGEIEEIDPIPPFSEGEFEIEDHLGSGSFGDVFQAAFKKNGETKGYYALKLSKTNTSDESLLNEYRMLRFIQKNPESVHFIVHLFEIQNLEDKVALIFELMTKNFHAYLKDHRQGLSFTQTQTFTKQLIDALCFLSNIDIIHGDLKPENILVSESGTLKIGDFGESHLAEDPENVLRSRKGTRFWRSPERILGLGLAKPADVWSIGATVAQMFTGKTSFKGENVEEMIAVHEKKLGKSYPPELITASKKTQTYQRGHRVRIRSESLKEAIEASSQLKGESGEKTDSFLSFLEKALEYHPNLRASPEELKEHPFLQTAEE